MCGIAGALLPDADPSVRMAAARRMVGSLKHRGPDDHGFHDADGVTIGMARLSIIDVAGGHQPIANEDGTCHIVCNGEIYNHADLRQRLERNGHVFKTHSDVETILHLYEDHGPECLSHVEGMFGVAIWDQRRRRLFLGRDRLGIKPLYYAATRDGLLFGSELKAIVQAGVAGVKLDPAAVDAYFTLGYVPAPLTIYKEVRKLEPGHTLVVEDGRVTTRAYWALKFRPDETMDEAACEAQGLELIRRAVRSHLMSEVPLGAFLSGGVDSGLIVALMSEMLDTPVRTFTIGYSGNVGGFLDERGYARTIAARYGTSHTEYDVSPDLDEVIDPIVDAFDEPFADDSVVPTYYISQLARRSVTVALSGLGGDELFGGYERYLGYKLSLDLDRLPAWWPRRAIANLVDAVPERKDGHYTVNHLKRFMRAAGMPQAERYLSYITVMDGLLKSGLYTPDFAASIAGTGVPSFDLAKRMQPNGAGWLSEAFRLDMGLYLPDDILTLTDRLSMAHSLELRVPFLDHRLVEFAATVPNRLKIRGFAKKYALKRIASRFLPREVLEHRKQGFASPMATWLRSDLQGRIRDMLAPARLERYGLIEPRAVSVLLDQHQSRQQAHERQIFTVLMFQKWCDRHLA